MVNQKNNQRERGNVFFALFGAVAVVGVIGAASMSIMRGPLTTMVEVNKRTQAESQMQLISRFTVIESANNDCETVVDGFIEPLEWDDASGASVDGVTIGAVSSDGGGWVPANIGVTRTDPWGTNYAYCVWDAGGTTASDNDAGCGAGARRLDGNKETAGANSSNYPVIAVISAGSDRVFDTVCRDFDNADGNNDDDLVDAGDTQLVYKATGADDVIVLSTYGDAAASSAGLWSLQSGNADVAEISKDLEVAGKAKFTANDTSSIFDISGVRGGFLLPDEDALTGASVCNLANDGILRRDTTTNPPTVQICGDTTGGGVYGWSNVAAGAANLPAIVDDDTEVRVDDSTPIITFDVNGTQKMSINATTLDAGSLNVTTTGTLAAGNTTITGTLGAGATTVADLTANGNTVLGDAATDTTTVTGPLTASETVTISNTAAADPALAVTGDITGTNVDLTGDLTLADTESIQWGDATVDITASSAADTLDIDAATTTINGVLNITNVGTADPALAVTGDITGVNVDLSGDITVGGNDIIMGTNTTGSVLVADGTNFSPAVMSGDVSITSAGVTTVADGSIDEAKLNMSNGASSGHCLKYIGSDLTWQACSDGGGGDGVGSDNIGDLNDVTDADAVGNILVNDGTDWHSVAPSNDIGIAADGTMTIQNTSVETGMLADNAVTFAKMQDVSTDILLGRGTAGSGGVEEISIGTGLTLTGTTLSVASGVSSLWTDNTTYITRDGFHVIDAAETEVPAALQAAGTRAFFYPNKGAFRGGSIPWGANWSDAEIGTDSFGYGEQSRARGDYSVALGYRSQAYSDHAVGLGYLASAYGSHSAAFGYFTLASGYNSMAFGSTVIAGADSTPQTSSGTTGKGNHSVAFGLGITTGSQLVQPRVSANESFGIFFGDQEDSAVTQEHVLALVGGKLLIDDVDGGTDTEQGCIRYNDTANVMEFSNDCESLTPTWTAMGGGASSIAADTLDFTEFKDAMALDASTSITADGTEVLSIVNTGTGNSFLVEDEAGDGSPFVIKADGKVGIGATSPKSNLHVYNGTGGAAVNVESDEASFSTLNFITAGNQSSLGGGSSKGWSVIARGDSWVTADNQNDMIFSSWNGTTWTDTMTLDSLNGNVGIGTSDPKSLLHVDGSVILGDGSETCSGGETDFPGAIRYNATTDVIEYCKDNAASDDSWEALVGASGSASDRIQDEENDTYIDVDTTNDGETNSISMVTDSTERLLIGNNIDGSLDILMFGKARIQSSNSGNLNLLNLYNSSAAAADVGVDIRFAGSASDKEMIQLKSGWDGAATTDAYFSILTRGSDSMTEKMRVASNGNVGIGTTDPKSLLHVAGSVILGDGAETCSGGETDFPGAIRYNATTDAIEYCKDNAASADSWEALAASGSIGAIDDLTDAYNDTAFDFDGDTVDNDDNLALGHEFATLDGTNPGARNTAIGATALDAVTEGDDNIAIGYNSLTTNTTGNSNIAIGSLALENNNGGIYNVAVGNSALNDNINGRGNVAIGLGALNSNSGGSRNVAIGEDAMEENIGGDRNVGIGNNVFRPIQAGEYNVVIGQGAVGNVVTADRGHFDDNVIIGGAAGIALKGGPDTANTSKNNIFIGARSGDTTTTGMDNILIGTDVDASSATASNELNIGDTIFGKLDTGRVGIGTAAPDKILHVTSSLEDVRFESTNNVAADSGMDIELVRSRDGGLVSDDDKIGAIKFLGFGSVDEDPAGLIAAYVDGSPGDSANDMPTRLEFNVATDGETIYSDGGAAEMVIKSSGYVGIATEDPKTLLDVAGSIKLGDGAETCSGGETDFQGAIRYNATTDVIEYCKDNAASDDSWETLATTGGGSSLWTDNTTHVSREGFHVIDAAETTLPAALDDDGTRAFFFPDLGAFRTGRINGGNDAWQNIGNVSFAHGLNAEASGEHAVALGREATVTGESAIALGFTTTASADGGTAIGSIATASGVYSVSLGRETTAGGYNATAIGTETIANGYNSMAFGRNVISGTGVVQTTDGTAGVGNYSMSFGLGDSGGTNDPRVTGNKSFGIFMGDQTDTDLDIEQTLGLFGTNQILIDPVTGVDTNQGCIRYNDTANQMEFSNNCESGTPTWAALGGASAAGSANEIQFNDGSSGLDASSDFTFNDTSDTLTVNGTINAADRIKIDGQAVTTVVSGSGGGSVTADSLDFTEFKDAMTLDASTDIEIADTDDDFEFSITNLDDGNSFTVNDEAGDTTPFVIDADGNVGIGNTAPGSLLDVGTAATMQMILNNAVDTADDPYSLGMASTASSERRFTLTTQEGIRQHSMQFGDGGGDETVFGVASSLDTGATWLPSFVVQGGGNVGIGTNDPKSLLHVAGSIILGDGAETCSGGETDFQGAIRYNATSDVIEFCKDNAASADSWETLATTGGGSSLWTDNTTHVSREGFHILDAGLAAGSTTAGLDGDGTYAFYDPDKGALRGGSITGGDGAWEDANIGNYSFAWGQNNVARGLYSTAIGMRNDAIGYSSLAVGSSSTASGNISTAIGSANTASGFLSTAMGSSNRANGYVSYAFGRSVRVGDGTAQTNDATADKGNYSVAFGLGNSLSATIPQVTANESFGIFFGDQSSSEVTQENVLALVGGKLLIDDVDGGSDTNQGCIRYNDTANQMEFANNCESGTPTWTAMGGVAADSLDFDDFDDTMELDASTSITADGTEVLSIVNTGTGNSFFVGDKATDDTPFVIDENGFVGIGTPNPAGKLSVYRNNSNSYITIEGDETSTAGLRILSTGDGETDLNEAGTTGWMMAVRGDTYGTTPPLQNDLIFTYWDGTDWNPGLSMDSTTGNLGIEINEPDAKLHINGSVILGDGAETCSGGETDFPGAIRYNATTDTIEFCKDNAASDDSWEDLAGGGGSSLWTDNTTYASYEGFSIINADQTTVPGALDNPGATMFYYPNKSAIRGGTVDNNVNAYRNSYIGANSFGFGTDTYASGSHSISMGYDSSVSNDYGIAMGHTSVVTGDYGAAIGSSNTVSANYGSAIGSSNTVSANYGTAIGAGGNVSELYGLTSGFGAAASGRYSAAFNRSTTASGFHSFATGWDTEASGYSSTSFGQDVIAGTGAGQVSDSTSGVGNFAVAFGLGDAAGTKPMVTGTSSFGVFMGDQSGADLDLENTFGMFGTAQVLFDPDMAASDTNQGCIRYNDTANQMEFSNNCESGSPTWTAMGGVTADSLDFSDFDDTMELDASTSITADGTEVLSIVNTGTGNSFLVEDEAGDGSPFVIDEAGFVGIGSTDPQALLEIEGNGDNVMILLDDTNGGSNDDVGIRNTGINLVFSNETLGQDFMEVGVEDNTSLGLRSTGADTNTLIRYYNDTHHWITGVYGSTDDNFAIRDQTAGTTRMVIDTSGNVGIGENNPDATLDVAGDIEYTGTLTDTSDRRLKTDIVPLSTDEMIAKLAQIDTYSFKMKDDVDGRTEFGVMAQELEEIFPVLVHTADDEMGTKSVNYVGLIAPMIEATKALKSENDALKAELASLKDQNNEVLAAINTMKQDVAGLKAHTNYNIQGASFANIGMLLLMILCGVFGTVIVLRRTPKNLK